MTDKPKNQTFLETFNWRYVLQVGALTGIILLYVGMIGMLESFNRREVVRDFVTLSQILLFAPAFIGGFWTARRIGEENNALVAIGAGVAVGLLSTVFTLMMLGLSQVSDINDILVNINRDWIEVITFDNRNELFTGISYLVGALAFAGGLGGVLSQLPRQIRTGLIFGLSFTLLFGTLGDTVSQIIEEIFDLFGENFIDWFDETFGDEPVDFIFRRGSLLQMPAIIIFTLTTLSGTLWAFFGNNVTSSYADLPPQQKQNTQRVGMVLFFGLLLVLPFLVGRALSDVLVLIGLYVLMGLGLNIAIGLAGLLDLGYVTNFAVGAYVMAVLTSETALGRGPEFINFWFVIPIALIAAMFTGFLFAVPVLKMRGDYLAIATLGFGEIIGKLAVSDWFKPLIGGAQGIQKIPKPTFFGTELVNPEQLYYVVLAACLVTLFVSIRINNSRTGRQWMAIREDEDVAAAMGIDTARAKLLAFTLSAATGGVAGAILAAKVGTVFPNSFIVLVSINVLSLIIVGGMGSNPGVVLGAFVLIGMPELLREFTEYRWLLYGVLLIFMMVNRPEGLWPSQVTRREINDPSVNRNVELDVNPTPRTESPNVTD